MTHSFDHQSHCFNCVNLNACKNATDCRIIKCTNDCAFSFHACKLAEHLSVTCPFEMIDCANKTNGCKHRILRCDLTNHLKHCPANVVRCSSFGMRRIKFALNRKNLKWPDPIGAQKQTLEGELLTKNQPVKGVNINDVLLERDYDQLHQFARLHPVKFQRMYGYLIGLKMDNLNDRQHKFYFMKYLLKNVKSKIFKDIESENCVVFNDEEGCSACKVRIRLLEQKRFTDLKHKYLEFDNILKEIDTYGEFCERKIYANPEFLIAYEEIFLDKTNKIDFEPESESPTTTISNEREIYDELLKRNEELLECVELDGALKLNVAKEMPCEIFQLQYETYRTKDTDFLTDCDQLVRRDEYEEHYAFYHDILIPNYDVVQSQCPFHDYGCKFFFNRIVFARKNQAKNGNFPQQLANLTVNRPTGTFVFNLDETTNERTTSAEKNLLDLPMEVIYEIVKYLDSNSLFNLSITSKVIFFFFSFFFKLKLLKMKNSQFTVVNLSMNYKNRKTLFNIPG